MEEWEDEEQAERNQQVMIKVEDCATGHWFTTWSHITDVVTSPPTRGLEAHRDGKVAGNPIVTEISSSDGSLIMNPQCHHMHYSSAAISQDLSSAAPWRTVNHMLPVHNLNDNNGTGYPSHLAVCKEEVSPEPEESSPSLDQAELEDPPPMKEKQQEEPLQRPQEADRLTLRRTRGSGYVSRMEYAVFPRLPVGLPEHKEKNSTLVQREPPEHKEKNSTLVQREPPEHKDKNSTLVQREPPEHKDKNSPLVQREPPEHKDKNSTLVQREPEPPQIKQEQEEESLQRPEEAAGSSLTSSVARSEDHENRKTEPVATSTEQHTKTRADAEDCGASQPTRNDHHQLLSPSHGPDEDVAEEENREDQSALNKLNSHKAQIVDVEGPRLSRGRKSSKQTPSMRSDTSGKKSYLKRQIRTHTGLKSKAPKVLRGDRTGQGKTCWPRPSEEGDEDGTPPRLSGKNSSPQPLPSDEEEEDMEEDEEWTPDASGGQVMGVAECTSGRTLRKRSRINYTEPEVPDDEHYYFCDRCGEFFLEECGVHGEPKFIEDSEVAKPATDRARKTLPPGFEIRKSRIPGAGLGVFYCGHPKLPVGTHFGPYEGVKTRKEEAVESGYSWVIRRERNRYDYIDAKDETCSNWMRYVNCARHEREQNLIAFQHKGGVLYRCHRPVARGEELLVWYGDEYAKELGIIFDELWHNKSTAKGVSSQSSQTQVFSCSECPYAFTSQVFLHKHLKRSHSDLYFQMLRSGHIALAAAQPINGSVNRQKPGGTDQPRSCSGQQPTKTLTQPREVKTHRMSYSGRKGHGRKQCDKSFIKLHQLKRHQLVHTGGKPYQCRQCEKRFSLSHHLKTHWRVHTGEKPFQCSQCEKSFSQSGDLNKHWRVHTGEKPYQCNHCEKSFSQPGHLKSHQLVHTGEKPYQCSQCEKRFSLSGDLNKHRRVHNGEKPYQCSQCEKSFSQSGNLKGHQRVHTGEKPYQCRQCEKRFSLSHHLKTHWRVHTGEKPFQCSQCEKRFSLSQELNKHQLVHTGEKPFQCSQCEKSFSQSGDLNKHRRVHDGEKPYQCSQCEKRFSLSGNLKSHQLVHTGEKSYQCNHCDKSFSQSRNLKRHQLVHTGEKSYQCNHCDKSFSQSQNLKRHQLVHTGEKPYQCNHCEKSFSMSGPLKIHQLVHTGEKPFQCSLCEKRFSQSGNLKSHHQLVHTGEKPYQCNHCEKSFSLSQNLKRHQLVHTGEKPYQCNHCEKSFSLSGHLKRHQLVHTGEKPYQCSQCDKSFSLPEKLNRHQLVHTGEKPYICKQCHRSFTQVCSLKAHLYIHTKGHTRPL